MSEIDVRSHVGHEGISGLVFTQSEISHFDPNRIMRFKSPCLCQSLANHLTGSRHPHDPQTGVGNSCTVPSDRIRKHDHDIQAAIGRMGQANTIPLCSLRSDLLSRASSGKIEEHRDRRMDMLRAHRGLMALAVLGFFAVACAAYLVIPLAQTSAPAPSVPDHKITTIPATLDRACRTGRATLYDECSDQL